MASLSEEDPNQLSSFDDDQMIDQLCLVLRHDTTRASLLELLNGFSDHEWNTFFLAVQQQGFSTLVYRRLKALGSDIALPDSVMHPLHQSSLTAATRNMLMLHEAARILTALRAQSLDVIPLKGLYLVENVYQDISLRTFSDLDLLVRKPDLDAAIACLQSLGYQLETYFSTRDANTDIKHVPPMVSQTGIIVEIHWTILEEESPFTIDSEGFWQRALPECVAGVNVLSLCPEDLLLHLCLHLGYQHQFNVGLRGLIDIAEVLYHFSGHVDWHSLTSIALQWGAQRVLYLVLKLANELLESEIPAEVFERLVPETVPDAILAHARTQLSRAGGQGVIMTPDLARLAMAQGLSARLKVMLSRVFISRQVLARLYNVSPRSLAIVWCYVKRFKDLLTHYGSALKPVLNRDKAALSEAAKKQTVEDLEAWMGKVGD